MAKRHEQETNPQSRYYDHYAKKLRDPQDNSGGKGKALLAGAVVGLFAVAGLGYWATQQAGDDKAATSSTTSPATTSSGSSVQQTSSPSTSSPTGPNPSVVPGWQVVQGKPADKVAYSVPAGWKQVPNVIWGQQNAEGLQSPNLFGVHSAATQGSGSCATEPSAPTTAVGLRGQVSDPPSSAATDAATRMAKTIGTKADGSAGPVPAAPKVTSVRVNGFMATLARTTATNGAPGGKNCNAVRSDVFAVAVPVGTKSTVWMLVRDQGGKQVPSDAEVMKMISTLTPRP